MTTNPDSRPQSSTRRSAIWRRTFIAVGFILGITGTTGSAYEHGRIITEESKIVRLEKQQHEDDDAIARLRQKSENDEHQINELKSRLAILSILSPDARTHGLHESGRITAAAEKKEPPHPLHEHISTGHGCNCRLENGWFVPCLGASECSPEIQRSCELMLHATCTKI